MALMQFNIVAHLNRHESIKQSKKNTKRETKKHEGWNYV